SCPSSLSASSHSPPALPPAGPRAADSSPRPIRHPLQIPDMVGDAPIGKIHASAAILLMIFIFPALFFQISAHAQQPFCLFHSRSPSSGAVFPSAGCFVLHLP